MQIKTTVVLAGLLSFSVAGTASAIEPFATLDGLKVQPLSTTEMERVRGTNGPPPPTTIPGPSMTHSKPDVAWLIGVLDGHANDHSKLAIIDAF